MFKEAEDNYFVSVLSGIWAGFTGGVFKAPAPVQDNSNDN